MRLSHIISSDKWKMIKKKSYGLKMQHSEVWVNLIKTGGNPPQKTLKNKGLLVFKNIPVSYTCHFHLGINGNTCTCSKLQFHFDRH